MDGLEGPAKVGGWAVILTAHPQTAAARIAQRGAHSRLESGIGTSRTEVDLYRDAAGRLALRGYPLVTLDTTVSQPEHVAVTLGARIAMLAGVPGRGAATA